MDLLPQVRRRHSEVVPRATSAVCWATHLPYFTSGAETVPALFKLASELILCGVVVSNLFQINSTDETTTPILIFPSQKAAVKRSIHFPVSFGLARAIFGKGKGKLHWYKPVTPIIFPRATAALS
jgi:hypothetical protein